MTDHTDVSDHVTLGFAHFSLASLILFVIDYVSSRLLLWVVPPDPTYGHGPAQVALAAFPVTLTVFVLFLFLSSGSSEKKNFHVLSFLVICSGAVWVYLGVAGLLPLPDDLPGLPCSSCGSALERTWEFMYEALKHPPWVMGQKLVKFYYAFFGPILLLKACVVGVLWARRARAPLRWLGKVME